MLMYANIVDAKNDFGAHTQCKIRENTRFQEPKKWIFQSVRYFDHDSTAEKETSY